MHVDFEDLGHRFGAHPFLFKGMNLTLLPGNTYAIIGPSGSGKSTLLGIIAGWIKPSTGKAIRTGIERTSWVFQNPHGVPRRTALDHVVLPYLARGFTRDKAEVVARAQLATFELSEKASDPFENLSGGEAQRLMLARGLAANPQLLLVDEPTAQLDIHTADSVNHAISAIRAEGTIVVVATHDAQTARSCNAIVDMSDFQ